MKLLISLLLTILLLSCGQSNENKEKTEAASPGEISLPAENQSVVDQQLTGILAEYFQLKDALVEADSVAIQLKAEKFLSVSDGFKTDSLTADEAIIESVLKIQSNISAEAKGLIGETDITEKRKAFRMITENLKSLVETLKYKGQTLYEQTCPMAFNDNEAATWLSNSTKIINPYLGKKHPKYAAGMLHCGEVTDTLSFR